ncbi:hypothetical protein O181_086713 [Austropuccinia psidii MF-1]|uniref:Uncharacterized protein n=1 Tax=Austropuccinia psidii MF-1 TaxID=1389203 RepID=A0A9Q3IME8_9BASI|nr:hypothetical protein [Austropuccinia psidii MF-1]
MYWIWSNYHDDLEDYINICRKMKVELDAIKINIKDLLLSLSILGNLPEKIDSTSSALTTSSHPYKITHYCANRKHNPNCTSQYKEQCFSKNPNLRPARRNNKRRYPANIPESAQESALITGSSAAFCFIKLIIDCDATHHMFNSKILFSTLNKIPPLRTASGDSSSSLEAEALGTMNLECKGETL